MKLSELSYKDVIREEDGTKLGKIQDITIDAATGKIISIHISNNFKFRGTKICGSNIIASHI